jgi:serine/threonine protein kinase
MTPERFRQIRNLFDAVIEREPGERRSFLEQACLGDRLLHAEVDRLLEAHYKRLGPMDRPAVVLDTGLDRMEGRQVGPYEILREIGTGGMATVYLARRADGLFERNVALKFVQPEASNQDVMRRFQQEQQILAGLDHPNIARLLDAGSIDSTSPYFVMEFVDGIPIDRYCDERRLNVKARVKLFQMVCSAVQYANRRGVVHRDLKPSNILVTVDGVPKLLDFGISKLLDEAQAPATAYLTRNSLRPMTPEYASPEQVKGESATVATDVYSLGVVLYEVLTGHRPYRMNNRVMHEIVRVICEEAPTRPSTAVTQDVTPDALSRARETTPGELKRELSGDIDSMLLKALEKEPRNRYPSAEEFEKDLSRYLLGEPVEARSNHAVRWLVAFMRRHSGWILAALCALAAIASGAVTIQGNILIMMGVLLAALLTGNLALSAEFGSDYARRNLGWITRFFAGVFIAVIVVSSLPRELTTNWLSALSAAISTWLGYYLLRWPFRSHWAGELILDISRRRQPLLMGLCVLMIVGTVLSAVDMLTEGVAFTTAHFVRCVSPVGLAVFLFVLNGRAEFRSRGIVSNGRLIRWPNVKAYAWSAAMGDFAVLQVWSKGLGQFWPAEKLLIRTEAKEQVSALLERQLSPWLR